MGKTDSDAQALAAAREAARRDAVAAQDLAEFVAEALASGDVGGRSRVSGVPVVPGGRLHQCLVLALDHPEVFAKLRAGHFESVSAAARSAGIPSAGARRRLTLTKDPRLWARALFHAVTEAELEIAADEIGSLQAAREQQRRRRIAAARDAAKRLGVQFRPR